MSTVRVVATGKRTLAKVPTEPVTIERTPYIDGLLRLGVLKRLPLDSSDPETPTSALLREPPRTGKGSSRANWLAFLTSVGVPHLEEDSRETLIRRYDEHEWEVGD
ncbi:hypothetical protein [Hoyosella altamirensis]|uniref:Uncharacterized protein n=1 Tax=Hoyosella altamirensis TaxID=616997 RepID=A0A839RT97_9ACTN|nr:hypothetical protein [Hoyosella altamirensis]MBB3040132.1 hypothetical protein [Hoyosella altamirensis]